jgi:hypothetical protein
MPRFENGDVIVFEGDSLTNRRMAPTYDTWPFLHLMNWQGTWADELMKLLFCWKPELNLTFHNAAVGGSNCRRVTERFEKFVFPHNPDWVLMTIGNNDPHQGVGLEEFREKMGTYVERVKRECEGRICFLIGDRPEVHAPEERIKKGLTKNVYHQVLCDLADTTSVFCIDFGRALVAKANALYKQSEAHTIYSDGGHLNQVGSIIVTGEVLKAFGIVTESPE